MPAPLPGFSNREVPPQTCTSTTYTLLSRRRLRWLGRVTHVENGHIQFIYILFGQLKCGSQSRGRPHLLFVDVFRCDLMAGELTEPWEKGARDRFEWRQAVRKCVSRAQETRPGKVGKEEGENKNSESPRIRRGLETRTDRT